MDEKLAIAGLEAHEREKLQVKMLEAQIKFNEECKKQDEKAEQERQKAAEKTAKERLSIRQKQLRIELEDAATSHYKNLTSEEDFAKEVNGIRQRYWDDLLHNYQLTEEQRTEIQKEQSEAQAEAEKEKYDKTMEMHKQYASLVTDIALPAGAGTSSATTTTNDPATLAVMKECIRIMRRLKVRLDEPLVTETYVTGKRGVNQAQKDFLFIAGGRFYINYKDDEEVNSLREVNLYGDLVREDAEVGNGTSLKIVPAKIVEYEIGTYKDGAETKNIIHTNVPVVGFYSLAQRSDYISHIQEAIEGKEEVGGNRDNYKTMEVAISTGCFYKQNITSGGQNTVHQYACPFTDFNQNTEFPNFRVIPSACTTFARMHRAPPA